MNPQKILKWLPLYGALIMGVLMASLPILAKHANIHGEGASMFVPLYLPGVFVAVLFIKLFSIEHGREAVAVICVIGTNMVIVWIFLFIACAILRRLLNSFAANNQE